MNIYDSEGAPNEEHLTPCEKAYGSRKHYDLAYGTLDEIFLAYGGDLMRGHTPMPEEDFKLMTQYMSNFHQISPCGLDDEVNVRAVSATTLHLKKSSGKVMRG